MIRSTYIFIIVSLIISVYATFAVKNIANAASFQLNEIKYQITQEQNNIHVLKTEIAILSGPQNIWRLANQHLNLEQIKVAQIISNTEIQEIGNTVCDVFEVHKTKKVTQPSCESPSGVKWRYKQPIYKQVKHQLEISTKNANFDQ